MTITRENERRYSINGSAKDCHFKFFTWFVREPHLSLKLSLSSVPILEWCLSTPNIKNGLMANSKKINAPKTIEYRSAPDW